MPTPGQAKLQAPQGGKAQLPFSSPQCSSFTASTWRSDNFLFHLQKHAVTRLQLPLGQEVTDILIHAKEGFSESHENSSIYRNITVLGIVYSSHRFCLHLVPAPQLSGELSCSPQLSVTHRWQAIRLSEFWTSGCVKTAAPFCLGLRVWTWAQKVERGRQAALHPGEFHPEGRKQSHRWMARDPRDKETTLRDICSSWHSRKPRQSHLHKSKENFCLV